MVDHMPEDVIWILGPNANGVLEVRESIGDERYDGSKIGLQDFLCHYFSNGDYTNSQEASINSMGTTTGGGKIFKVRWGFPGCGKSGSLRVCVVAYCDGLRVVIAGASIRKAGPSIETADGSV